MAEVTVTINNRSYPVACEDGQEEHITRLASYLDMRVQELIKGVGQIGDAHLMVMAGLTVADELSEVYEKLAATTGDDDKSAAAPEKAPDAPDPALDAAAAALNAVAERVERIAAGLENA